MNIFKRRREVWERIGVVCVLTGFFVVWEMWWPFYFLYDDNATQFLPWYVYNARVLRNDFRLALVNWHQFLGYDHLSSGQTGVLYPPIYLAVWLSEWCAGNVYWTIELLAIGHLILGGLGLYIWLGWYRVEWWIRIFSCGYWLSLPMVMGLSRSWIVMSYFVGYTPWLLLMCMAVMRKAVGLTMLGHAVVLALYFFTGQVQMVLLVFIGEFFLWVFYRNRVGYFSKGLKMMVVSWILAVTTILPLAWPMWGAMRDSVARSSQVVLWSFLAHRVDVLDFVWAQGGWYRSAVIFKASSILFFIGIVPVAVWVLVLVKGKSHKDYMSRVLAIIAGIFWLSSTLFYVGLYWIPVVNRLRWPFKHLEMVALLVMVVTALEIQKHVGENLRRRWGWGLVLGGCLGMNWVQLTWYGDQMLLADKQIRPHVTNLPAVEEGYRWATYGDVDKYQDSSAWLTYNFATLKGVDHVGGYDPLKSKKVRALVGNINGESGYDGKVGSEVVDKWRQLGVGYVVTTPDKVVDLENAELELVELEGLVATMKVVEPVAVVSRVEGDVKTKLNYRIRGNSVEIILPDDKGGVVEALFQPLEGLTIWGSGQLLVVDKVEFPLRVLVPEGVDLLVLVYHNSAFNKGLAVVVVVWMIILIGFWHDLYRKNGLFIYW